MVRILLRRALSCQKLQAYSASCVKARHCSSISLHDLDFSPNLSEWNPDQVSRLVDSFKLVKKFIDEEQEERLVKEVQPHLKRLVYEKDHWDKAIVGFRETERKQWNAENKKVIDAIRSVGFPPQAKTLPYVHVLDLAEDGHIKAHIDSSRFCGDTVVVLSLLSDCVLKLVQDRDKNFSVKCLIPKHSLYIMKGVSRYDYSHEILANEEATFNGEQVSKTRRISIVCRNEP